MDASALTHPIAQALLRRIRSEDRSGAWDAEPDAALLAPFIVTKAQKRELPMMGDPDPDILWRVEMFYAAVAWELERRSGHAVAPILNIHHEGWGRVLLVAGRLVALNAHVRELHRFGFEDLPTLIAKAEKLVEEGAETIARFPEIAAA